MKPENDSYIKLVKFGVPEEEAEGHDELGIPYKTVYVKRDEYMKNRITTKYCTVVRKDKPREVE